MAKKQTPLTAEALKHEEARRKNIPTAEFQSVMKNRGTLARAGVAVGVPLKIEYA